MLGKEALVVLTNLSRLMAAKMEDSILHTRGWVHVRITIAAVRLYPFMIHGAYPPSPLSDREPDWGSSYIWDWHNKFCARIVSCTSAQNSFVYCPTSNFPPVLNHKTRVGDMWTTDGGILQRFVYGCLWGKKGTRREKKNGGKISA